MRVKTILLQTAVIGAMFTGPAVAQDFQRHYNLAGGGDISIRNVSGNIRVAGYDGAEIIVTATREGRDRDRVEIVDASGDNAIDIYVQYPRQGNTEASVEFEILAPRSIPYNYEDLSSVSGDVGVASIAGRVLAQSVSGRIQIQGVAGAVNAGSVSGDVYVQIIQAGGNGPMKFASISGDVIVHAPPDLDAYVDMSTLSGSLWTDFPIRISGRWPFFFRSARGRLGSGAASLKISSISGRVCLLVNH